MPSGAGRMTQTEVPETHGAGHAEPLVAGAHWSIFLPAAVVALLWAAIYLWANGWTPRLSGIASLSLAVEAIIVPLLILHAWGRTWALGVRVGARGLEARAGFPRRQRIEVGAREISSVRFRQTPLQRLLGAGSIELRMESGASIRLDDLDRAAEVANAIRGLMASCRNHADGDGTAVPSQLG